VRGCHPVSHTGLRCLTPPGYLGAAASGRASGLASGFDGGGDACDVHLPSAQIGLPLAHGRSHAPQCFALVPVSTQPPPQRSCLAGQAATGAVQTPFAHERDSHFCAQLPQLSGSASRSMQADPQKLRPIVHGTTQRPVRQICFASQGVSSTRSTHFQSVWALQVRQLPLQLPLQQRPATHAPEAQSPPALQVSPGAF
jgi:hypothetical protein